MRKPSLAKAFDFPREFMVKILYNPINMVEKVKSNLKNRSYVSWIGRFVPIKNLPVLLRIAESLPNIKFKIVGQKTNSISQLDLDTIKKLKGLKNVEIIDFIDRDHILEFLNNSILLLNTSNQEGLANTFLEALLVGTPIVTTSKVNPDNMINMNRFGIVGGNHEEMINAIKSISKNFEYKTFYSRSYSFLKQHFDSKNQASKFIAYLQNQS